MKANILLNVFPFPSFGLIALFLCQVPSQPLFAQTRPIVIVHGAWGGAHHWKPVSELLRDGYDGSVRRASLTGLGERSHLASREVDLNTHIRDVVNLIEFDDLHSVVLIGHSYGGVVISGVAEVIPDRISKLVYLDAHLLEDGEFYFSRHPEQQAKLTKRANEAGEGYLIPVDWKNDVNDTPHPLKAMVTPLSRKKADAVAIPAVYWLFTDGGDAKDDLRFDYFVRAQERGYQTRTLSWGHNPHRKRPAELATELREVLSN